MVVCTKGNGNEVYPMAKVLDFQHSQACLELEEKILALVFSKIIF